MSDKEQLQQQRDHELEIIRRRLFVDAFLETLRRGTGSDGQTPEKVAYGALEAFDSKFKKD